MIFENVKAENFMQFKSLDLKLDKRGICLIQGEIEGNSFADSNTSGKTTAAVHSICWGVFGKTVVGLSADDVINDEVNKNCLVHIRIKDNDKTYSILRYRKHKKFKNNLFFYSCDLVSSNPCQYDLTKSSNAETQKEINKTFHLDWDVFTNSIVFGAGNIKRFSEYNDAERKELLDKILNLEILKVLQGKAKLEIKDIQTNSDSLKENLDNFKVTLSTYKEQLTELLDNDKLFESRNKNRITEIKKDIKELREKADNIEIIDVNKQSLLLEKVKDELGRISISKKELEKTSEGISDLRISIESKKIEAKNIKQEADKLTNKISGIVNDNRGDCDSCGQDITEDSKEKFMLKFKRELTLKEVAHTEHASCIQHLNTSLDKLKQAYKDTIDELNVKDKKYWEYKVGLEKKIEKAESNKTLIDIITNQIKLKKEEIKNSKEEVNPYESLLTGKKKEIALLEKEYSENQIKYDSITNELPYYEFWERGFSNEGIKSLLLDNVIPYLTEKTNYYLQFLTNGEIKVTFSTQKELKSTKEKRDKLDILLYKNGKKYRFEKTSSGEKKRIDICISLALQSLLSSNNHINISVYDEVFDSLDETGTECVVNLLKEEAKHKESIFVISHSINLKDKFQNSITIKKKGDISYI